MIRIAVVDENTMVAQKMIQMLNRYQNNVENSIYSSAFLSPDQCFLNLDRHFSVIIINYDCFSADYNRIIEEFKRKDPDVNIIFYTASYDAAIKGYEKNQVDFLYYPVSYKSLSYKITKAILGNAKSKTKDIILNVDKGVFRCSIDDLYYVEVLDHILIYHTSYGDFSERGSIRNLEEKLEVCDFCRCYNCYLVNLKYVERVEKDQIIIQGKKLPLGRTKKKAFLEKLTDYQQIAPTDHIKQTFSDHYCKGET